MATGSPGGARAPEAETSAPSGRHASRREAVSYCFHEDNYFNWNTLLHFKISLTQLVHKPKKTSHRHLVHHDSSAKSDQPEPRFPLELSCCPPLMCFILDEETVTETIRLWNVCKRSIYVLCCGLWDETARLGASWYCSPRTRFLLRPGFAAKMKIKVTPRGCVPIPNATTALQIAVGHKRDNVVGYIVIPICVKFLSYVPPCFGEGG